MNDVATKLEGVQNKLGIPSFERRYDFPKPNSQEDAAGPSSGTPSGLKLEKKEGPISKLVLDGNAIATEATYGLMSQVIKDMVFNQSR